MTSGPTNGNSAQIDTVDRMKEGDCKVGEWQVGQEAEERAKW